MLREGKDGTLSEDEASKRLERARHWVWTAIDPESKLGLAIESGPRTLAMAQGVVHRVVQKLAASWVPLGVTDGNRAYTMACLAHFGFWHQPERTRAQGPAPKPRWLLLPALLPLCLSGLWPLLLCRLIVLPILRPIRARSLRESRHR